MRRVMVISSCAVLIIAVATAFFLRTEHERSFDHRFDKASLKIRALSQEINDQAQAKPNEAAENE